jgi:hypothetical protein
LREAGFDKQTIADFLGQETAGMAGHYSRDADLKGKIRKVIDHIVYLIEVTLIKSLK